MFGSSGRPAVNLWDLGRYKMIIGDRVPPPPKKKLSCEHNLNFAEMTCPNKAKKWVRHKNYCYYFSSGLDKKDLRTWFEVPLRCSELYPSVENELVTRLTIHSEEEKVNMLLYIS